MSNTLYSRLLVTGSFLLPEVTDTEIKTVENLITQAGHQPLLAITKEMAQLSFDIYYQYTKKKSSLEKRLNLYTNDIASITTGFRTPLIVIYNSFKQSVPLFDFSVTPRPSDPYIQRTVQKFSHQINNCKTENLATTATRIFTHCEEFPLLTNDEKYKLGVVASLTTFREFYTKIPFRRKR